MRKFSGIGWLLLCGTAVGVFAQNPAPLNPSSQNIQGAIPRREISRAENVERARENSSSRAILIRRGTLGFRTRLNKEQKKAIAPDVVDLNRHAAFLQNSDTGLMKIFPDLGCTDNARVVRADEICLSQVPMSGFYSFREREHTTDYLADVRLKKDYLISDGLLSQGILVALGDVPLEGVTRASGGIKFLTEYQPEETSEQALKQTAQLVQGIEADGYFYRKGLPAQENTTYALRVIAYRGKVIQPVRGFPFNMLDGDDRVDLTVAFRLLKKDAATGNYTVLWKELNRQDAPKILYPKRNKNKKFQRTR